MTVAVAQGLDSVHIMGQLHANHVLQQQIRPLAAGVEAALEGRRTAVSELLGGLALGGAASPIATTAPAEARSAGPARLGGMAARERGWGEGVQGVPGR